MKQLEKLNGLSQKFKALDSTELKEVIGGQSLPCDYPTASTTYVWNPPRQDPDTGSCSDCCYIA